MLTQACFLVRHAVLMEEGICPKLLAIYPKTGCKRKAISFGPES